MLNSLPLDLLQAAKDLMETQDVFESCVSCGSVLGSCIHSSPIHEDDLAQLGIPGETEPKAQLSGEKEDVIVNPMYKTSTTRRPY